MRRGKRGRDVGKEMKGHKKDVSRMVCRGGERQRKKLGQSDLKSFPFFPCKVQKERKGEKEKARERERDREKERERKGERES